MDLNIDGLYKILRQNHPMIYKQDIEWLEKGRVYANKKIAEENNSINSKFFMVNYYINMFKEEHLRIQLDRNILSQPYYPKFFAIFNGKVLHVIYSHDNRIPVGMNITHINNKPFKNYLKEFVLYNNGSDDEISDLVINSNILFLDYANPFLLAPHTIRMNNDIKNIKLQYVLCSQYLINKFNPSYFNNLEEFSIYKEENNIIYLKIPSFEYVDYNYLKKLLPANKIVVDLRNNLGGDVKYVQDFFNVVYKINVKWGVTVKNSLFVNEYNYRNINSDKLDTVTVMKCRGPKVVEKNDKITLPKLEILVNEFSKSACRTFCQIAQLYLKNVKIKGKIKLYPICGNSLLIETAQYRLYCPTSCYECGSLLPKLYKVDDKKINNMLKR
jgi:hypothetical protein